MPDTSPGTEDAAMNKTGEIPAPWSLQCSKESVFLSGLSLCLRNRSLCPCSREADCSRIAQALRKLCLPPVPSRAGAAAAGKCDQCQPVPCCLPSPEGKIAGNMSSFLLPDERQQRCTRELRGVMDQGPVEVNHCPAWRARRRDQRTDRAKATMLLPPRGELKIFFSPGSQINKVLGVFQISKKKKVTTALKSDRLVGGFVDRLVVLGIRC